MEDKVVTIHTVRQPGARDPKRKHAQPPRWPRRSAPMTLTQRAVEETAQTALNPAARKAADQRADADLLEEFAALRRKRAELKAEGELARRHPELARKVEQVEDQLAYRQAVRMLREAAAVRLWSEQHCHEWSERKRAHMAAALDVLDLKTRELLQVLQESGIAGVADLMDEIAAASSSCDADEDEDDDGDYGTRDCND